METNERTHFSGRCCGTVQVNTKNGAKYNNDGTYAKNTEGTDTRAVTCPKTLILHDRRGLQRRNRGEHEGKMEKEVRQEGKTWLRLIWRVVKNDEEGKKGDGKKD